LRSVCGAEEEEEGEGEGRFEIEERDRGRRECPAIERAGVSMSTIAGEHAKTTVGKLCNRLLSRAQTADWKRVIRKSRTGRDAVRK
jgi:hypothetical protein